MGAKSRFYGELWSYGKKQPQRLSGELSMRFHVRGWLVGVMGETQARGKKNGQDEITIYMTEGSSTMEPTSLGVIYLDPDTSLPRFRPSEFVVLEVERHKSP